MEHVPDETDLRIIALLQKDGRISNVEIARDLGLAEGTIRKRLERLLEEGHIQIKAVADPAKAGFPNRVFVGIESDLAQLEGIATKLASLPEVYSVSLVTGTYDLVVEIVLPSGDQLLSFLLDRVATIPGVKRTETCQVLQVVKQASDWTIPDQRQAKGGKRAHTGVIPGSVVIPS